MLHHKVRRIDPPVLTLPARKRKLKFEQLRRVYRKRFKKYRVVRLSVRLLWVVLYPQWVKLTYGFEVLQNSAQKSWRKTSRWYNLVALRQYVEATGDDVIQVADSAVVKVLGRVQVAAQNKTSDAFFCDSYLCPDLYVSRLSKGAMVHGGSNLVTYSRTAICHDLFDVERDFTSEELHGRFLIREKSRRLRLRQTDEHPVELSVAANFVDACAPNYAHWLTEVLPRIAVFCSISDLKDVPIIVNDGLHPNLMESLFLIAGSDREIILIPIGRSIKVNILYVTSVAGYVPFDRRHRNGPALSHGVFSPWAFNQIKNQLDWQKLENDLGIFPRKIYLRRNSSGRKIVNAFKLEQLLIDQGYEIVEPERLTFMQQVALFRSADVIVSSSGAALANIIFTKNKAKIFIIIGEHPGTSYGYWPNIASAVGREVNYILAKPLNWAVDGIHSNLQVDLSVIRKALDD